MSHTPTTSSFPSTPPSASSLRSTHSQDSERSAYSSTSEQSSLSVASSSSGEIPMHPLHEEGKRAVVVLPERSLGAVNPDPIIPGQSLPSPFPPTTTPHPPTSARTVSSSSIATRRALGEGNVNSPSPLVAEDGLEQSMKALGIAEKEGLGRKALLERRFAKANKPSLISPTDQLQSPCSAKLVNAKKKHFVKGKPVSLSSSFTAAQAQSASESKGELKKGIRMMEL